MGLFLIALAILGAGAVASALLAPRDALAHVVATACGAAGSAVGLALPSERRLRARLRVTIAPYAAEPYPQLAGVTPRCEKRAASGHPVPL